MSTLKDFLNFIASGYGLLLMFSAGNLFFALTPPSPFQTFAIYSEEEALPPPETLLLNAAEISTVPAFPSKGKTDNAVLEETPLMEGSPNPEWWLNSGGQFVIDRGIGKTLHGRLSADSPWRQKYAVSNPTDTENGYRPQNIFRLISKRTWHNFTQKVYVQILSYNQSRSPNHNGSNGVFLLSRYQNENNLYSVGIRVDGGAVIKKKWGGTYYTLAYKQEWTEGSPYENFLPEKHWLGIGADIENTPQGVKITLLLDKDGSGVWIPALTAIDPGGEVPPLKNPGYAGIRADFMDAEFQRAAFQEH